MLKPQLDPNLEGNPQADLAPELAPRLLRLRVISAHNLPKTRDERCVPQAWDEFESPCDFAQLPLTTADVASPMCEVCRIAPALECLLWACNVREGPARPLDMSHTTPEVERLRLTLIRSSPQFELLELILPGHPPRSSCLCSY